MITTNNDNNGGYEDKTADLYRLVHDIVPFFMSLDCILIIPILTHGSQMISLKG